MTDTTVHAGARGNVRRRLMKSAERLLASSVDGSISTREVCSGANVTAPTLYHHFADKEALLDAVVLEGFTAYLGRKRSLMGTGSVDEAFRTGWDMHVSFGCENPGHYRLMFGNPRARSVPPAARLAHDDLARTVADWERRSRLRVPVDVATATMSAAAVGVTLDLIQRDASSSDPMSAQVRETVFRALFDVPVADDTLSAGPTRPARELLNALPHGALAPLRSTETALLREWLSAIADGAEDHERKTP